VNPGSWKPHVVIPNDAMRLPSMPAAGGARGTTPGVMHQLRTSLFSDSHLTLIYSSVLSADNEPLAHNTHPVCFPGSSLNALA
jgi:hypothetical protein